MGRRLWFTCARKRHDACRRTASRTPSGAGTLRDNIPRGHFIASFSSTAHIDPVLWRNVEGPSYVSEVAWPRASPSPSSKSFRQKHANLSPHFSGLLMQFGGKLCAVVVAADITMLQRVEEARFALAQRLTSPISVNGPFWEVAFQEIAYEGTKAICPPSDCR
jgi:hypothetical protein